MTYPPSPSGYPASPPPAGYPAAQPPAAYGAPAVPSGPSRLPVYLTAGVAALGLVALLVSFAPGRTMSDLGAAFELPGDSNWTIAALVAGLLAAVSLLPTVKSYAPVVAVLALLAFLLVAVQLFSGGDGISIGWGLWIALLVTMTQAAMAVGALLFETGTITPPAPRPQFEAYGQYGPPAAGYYGQPAGQPAGQQGGPQHAVPGAPTPGYAPPVGAQQPAAPGGYGPAGYGLQDANLDTPPTGFPSLGQQQSAAPDPSGQTPS